ncbi:MAG: hypothetical protein COV55_00605 [Candidatus Komeilibacteria bacterium CG11_big_fil_rev_8_21_14_0_20_36_20]|uniref:Uncharacterized protein n=1 Tax=Candidatus Komeilibacteria bacterium CG11_big_fil_rev_8_21_14_0_20_36_20 TaxID=1974477 RepID=A0A2H0NEB1_9BACT|nr:MAG: hypothetical protein COV55_00605 [Candidatus Komeilibacteria bacterium CG11_big_fil_rev_8_21_14_0_20_36_20]PIR81683.1 MAG: hypothetical protein COU21_02460 [Candidatus Komeilibacteria bacterium CG10_big_fil_rev_8_21_14_0_10_36_65]PJC55614.1 MAG: hypothetical protein CO027_01270 [Candidatus Komeilibacteria bacterium CG_4_9_14_0_2_um_filter_36_13]
MVKKSHYQKLALILIVVFFVSVWLEPRFLKDIPLMFSGNDPYGLVISFGLLSLLVLAILYLFFGAGTFSINRASNLSVKFCYVALASGALIPLLVLLLFVLSQTGDSMGLLLILPFIYLAGIFAVVSLILSIISILKK